MHNTVWYHYIADQNIIRYKTVQFALKKKKCKASTRAPHCNRHAIYSNIIINEGDGKKWKWYNFSLDYRISVDDHDWSMGVRS